MNEDYYDELIESSCVAGGDPGVPELMASALEEEALHADDEGPFDEAEPATYRPRPMDDGTTLTEPPFVAMHEIAPEDDAGPVQRLWRKLTGNS